MADEQTRSDEIRELPPSSSARRWLIRIALLGVAFLVGFLPMWWAKMGVSRDLEQAKRELRRSHLQNSLSAAVVYARRGEYETARQSASSFFTDVQAELDNSGSTVLTEQEKTQMPALLASRDDIIPLLSRGDQASAERLSNIYVDYRSATALRQP